MWNFYAKLVKADMLLVDSQFQLVSTIINGKDNSRNEVSGI